MDVAIAGTTILHDIDWALAARTCWGVVGANGSGKSTFLALVAGIAWPVPGRGRRRYDFGAGVQTDAVAARKAIALVGHELQNRYVRFGWNFSAQEIVLSGIFRTDVPRRGPTHAEAMQARATLRDLDLEPLARRRFLELSRGEQRRVLIARALASRPAVLLLDEPASGLDPESRALLHAIIARAAAQTTVVCSGHEIGDVPEVVQHVLKLDDGRVLCRGSRRVLAAADMPDEAAAIHGRARRSQGTHTPLVQVEHADVWLGERHVLREIDFRLLPGEQWLVTGASGAGKSTFMKLLHGQLRPAVGGSVSWPALGNPRNIWRLRKLVGYVSAELQADYRYAATVRQCIASGIESSMGLTRPISADEHGRVEKLLERFALEALAERPLTALSYGQMHRVLLARTLINEPRLVLLDEPWEGLDRATRGLVRAQLEAAMASGTQLVCASHVGGMGLALTHEATMAAGRLRARSLGRVRRGGERVSPRES